MATTSIAGLGTWGVVSFVRTGESNLKSKDENSNLTSVSPSFSCQILKITDAAKKQVEEMDHVSKKSQDEKANTDNRQFWENVENACKDAKGKASLKVYVTEEGGIWKYDTEDQKNWPQ